MEQIMFSIVIPCYNVEKYISNTIESVINQTFDDFELILINDGSRDKTYEIIEFYAKQDKRIKLINKNNEGVSKTRNLGIKIAKGKYVYFLDGDDYIEKNLLEEANLILQDKGIGMISFGYDVKYGLNFKIYHNKKYHKYIFESKEFLRYFLKREISQSICSFIVKKELLENLNFDFRLITGEDLDFQMRLLLKKNFKIFYSSFIYFHYIKRENSATTQKMIPLKNLYTLNSLNMIRKDMLANDISEFKEYHILRFFYIIKGLAENNFLKEDEKKIKNKIKESEYILKDLKFGLNKTKIILFILKVSYKIDLKIVLFIFKVNKILSIKEEK